MKEKVPYYEMMKLVTKDSPDKYREFAHEANLLFKEWWGSDKTMDCEVDDDEITMRMGRKTLVYKR
jgi:uncharacterized protein YbaA (DUF1428 family)